MHWRAVVALDPNAERQRQQMDEECLIKKKQINKNHRESEQNPGKNNSQELTVI